MIAWALVFSLSGSQGYVVPNIVSEEACKALGAQIRAEFYLINPKIRCVQYELAAKGVVE